jgi:simple sugar transport system ATP-binding protein
MVDLAHPGQPRSTPALVDLAGISRRFGGVQALAGVDFTVQPGEIHCLAGENGCGKSTLIKILAGVLPPDSGRITLDGTDHPSLSPAASQAAGIQIIYQDLALFPHLTVAENILFHDHAGHAARLVRPRHQRVAAAAVLARLGVTLPLDAAVQDLPIALRQLVAIARALAVAARLVVMDEPTASLTHHETDALLATIRSLQAQGIATVLVSHRLDDMLRIGDRVTVLRDGRNAGTFAMNALDRAQLHRLISGQADAAAPRPPFTGDAPPVLEVRGLTRAGQFADVSLAVRPGEILGLTGRLGSGRTELALALFGLNPPDAGEILVDGRPVVFGDNRAAIRAGLGYVPEDRVALGLVMPQSIADNTVVTVLARLAGRLGLIDGRRRRETISRWISGLQVKTTTAERPVQELSGGNQQRVVLAKWLATEPRVLILDSPTAGIDVGAKAALFRTVGELAARGLAIILISDEAEEVLHQAHTVLVMRGGRITGRHAPAETSEAQLREAIHA